MNLTCALHRTNPVSGNIAQCIDDATERVVIAVVAPTGIFTGDGVEAVVCAKHADLLAGTYGAIRVPTDDDDRIPALGSVWLHREQTGWECKVVAIMRSKGAGANVVIEYEVGTYSGNETEMDIVSAEIFHRLWEAKE